MAPPARGSRRYIRQRGSYDEIEESYDNGLFTTDGTLSRRAKIYVIIILALLANIISMLRSSRVDTPLFNGLIPKLPTTGVNPLTYQKQSEETEPPFQPSKYDYRKEPVRTESTLPDPQLNSSSHLLALVMSARENVEARQAIRDSWAKGHSNILFLLGGPDAEKDKLEGPTITTKDLKEEQEQYNDLLDTIHPDTYRALPYKLHYALQWIHKQQQQFHWILKVDDNVVVRMNQLQQLVLQKYNHKHPIIIGNIVEESEKQLRGKWAEDPHYQPLHYPPWPRGASGYVLSQPVAEYVGTATDLYYYQGEDVSLGIWLQEAAHSHFKSELTWIHEPTFVWQDGCDESYIVTGHDLAPDVLKGCFFSHGGDQLQEHQSRIYHQDRPVLLHNGNVDDEESPLINLPEVELEEPTVR